MIKCKLLSAPFFS